METEEAVAAVICRAHHHHVDRVKCQGGSGQLFYPYGTAAITSSRTITGTVNIFPGTPPDGSGVAPPLPFVNGQASAMVTVPSGPGIYPFWVNYSGDSNNLPSQSTATLQQVITGSTSGNYAAQTGGLSHQSTITINLQ